jgi:hypothetical protein
LDGLQGNCTLQRLAGQSDDLLNLLLIAQNCKYDFSESDRFLLDVPVRPSFLPVSRTDFLEKKKMGTF